MAPERQRRVLAVVKGLGPGGAEQLLVTTAGAIDRSRYELEVAYVLPWKGHLVEPLAERGVAARCVGGRRGLVDPRWLRRLRRLLAGGRYDVVHLHSPVVAAACRLLVRTVPRASRPAVVSTEHNSWASHARPTRLANRATFRLGDAWLAVSDDVRSSMPAPLRPRTEVLVHGIDLAAFAASPEVREATRAELGVGPGTVVVLTVANLRRTKGYPDLLAAARTVLDRGADVRFLAVGQGPMEAELAELAGSLGLGDGFRFLGFRRDTAALLAAADVFAMASHHEGYPIAAMEAMAAGLPVVATAVGGLPEAVEAGTTGLLVPPRDPARLAEALLELAGDRDRRAAMGAAGRERAARFDFGTAMRRMEAIYDEVAPRR